MKCVSPLVMIFFFIFLPPERSASLSRSTLCRSFPPPLFTCLRCVLLCFSTVVLMITAPLFAIISVLIRLTSPGPTFFVRGSATISSLTVPVVSVFVAARAQRD